MTGSLSDVDLVFGGAYDIEVSTCRLLQYLVSLPRIYIYSLRRVKASQYSSVYPLSLSSTS